MSLRGSVGVDVPGVALLDPAREDEWRATAGDRYRVGTGGGSDGRYLSNVVAAFGLGNSTLLGLLKELFSLSDSDLSQRLSNLPANGGDEALVVQKVARLRGVLACSRV